MPTWTTAELTAIVNSGDGFSDAAYYDGGASPIYGAFLNDYQEIELASGAISSAGPAFICASSDVPGAVKGKALIRAGVSYTVTAVKPDGTGMTTLVLRKA